MTYVHVLYHRHSEHTYRAHDRLVHTKPVLLFTVMERSSDKKALCSLEPARLAHRPHSSPYVHRVQIAKLQEPYNAVFRVFFVKLPHSVESRTEKCEKYIPAAAEESAIKLCSAPVRVEIPVLRPLRQIIRGERVLGVPVLPFPGRIAFDRKLLAGQYTESVAKRPVPASKPEGRKAWPVNRGSVGKCGG